MDIWQHPNGLQACRRNKGCLFAFVAPDKASPDPLAQEVAIPGLFEVMMFLDMV